MKPTVASFRLAETVETCYGCTQCAHFCPFYPALFTVLEKESDIQKGNWFEGADAIIDLCYDCKLCVAACPFDKDLPHDLLMVKSENAAIRGRSLIGTLFSQLGRVQVWGSRLSPFVNFLLQNPVSRRLLERVVGLHRQRIMPIFYRKTFQSWFKSRKKERPARTSGRKVAYFHGCFTNYHRPEEGIAAVRILEKNGITVVLPKQVCCGLPRVSEGDLEGFRNYDRNVSYLEPWIDAGYDIVVTSVPCSLTLKKEVPKYSGSPAAVKVASRTYDISEYLLKLLRENELVLPDREVRESIAYHVACHLKAQEMGYPGYELLKLVPGVTRQLIDRGCCGLAGTSGYHKEGFDLAQKIGAPMIESVASSRATLAASDCPKCNIQIRQGTGVAAVHPLEIFVRGYGL